MSDDNLKKITALSETSGKRLTPSVEYEIHSVIRAFDKTEELIEKICNRHKDDVFLKISVKFDYA